MCLLTRPEAARFYAVHQEQPFFSRLLDFMTSGRIVAMELLAEGCVCLSHLQGIGAGHLKALHFLALGLACQGSACVLGNGEGGGVFFQEHAQKEKLSEKTFASEEHVMTGN